MSCESQPTIANAAAAAVAAVAGAPQVAAETAQTAAAALELAPRNLKELFAQLDLACRQQQAKEHARMQAEHKRHAMDFAVNRLLPRLVSARCNGRWLLTLREEAKCTANVAPAEEQEHIVFATQLATTLPHLAEVLPASWHMSVINACHAELRYVPLVGDWVMVDANLHLVAALADPAPASALASALPSALVDPVSAAQTVHTKHLVPCRVVKTDAKFPGDLVVAWPWKETEAVKFDFATGEAHRVVTVGTATATATQTTPMKSVASVASLHEFRVEAGDVTPADIPSPEDTNYEPMPGFQRAIELASMPDWPSRCTVLDRLLTGRSYLIKRVDGQVVPALLQCVRGNGRNLESTEARFVSCSGCNEWISLASTHIVAALPLRCLDLGRFMYAKATTATMAISANDWKTPQPVVWVDRPSILGIHPVFSLVDLGTRRVVYPDCFAVGHVGPLNSLLVYPLVCGLSPQGLRDMFGHMGLYVHERVSA